MKFIHKTLFLILIISLIGCKNKVKKSQIVYDKNTKTILYNNKPFTGIVNGEDEESYWSAEIKDGNIISETERQPNGYKIIKYPNDTFEYYNNNGKCISKESFYQSLD